MNLLPINLDLVAAETSAFAQLRGIKGYAQSWTELAAHAQMIMTCYQELRKEQSSELYNISNSQHLVVASRILDSLTLAESGISPNERQDWTLLGMLAYGMWGNFLSANAMKTRLNSETLSRPITAAIVATCTPQVADKHQNAVLKSTAAANYVKKLLKFLRSGDDADSEGLDRLLMKCLADADSFESAMLRSARVVLWQVIELSAIRNVKSRFPNLAGDYSKRLFSSGVRVLLPPQYTALNSRQLADRSWNALIALHTSAGKTLLGEMCLLAALDAGPGLAVYVAPYVALGRQVANGIKRHVPNSVRVHTLVGGFRAEDILQPDIHRELVVATPERVDALLRKSPELMNYLTCVVVDEAHHIGSGNRGARLEGLLSRIKMGEAKTQSNRIVLLSAVVHEYDRLQRWLNIPDSGVVTDDWRPTARRLGVWGRDGQVRWFRGSDIVRRPHSENSEVLGKRLVPWPNVNFYAAKHIGSKKKQVPDAMDNVAFFADYLWNEFNDVCLCVCMTKSTTRQLAWRLACRFPLLEPIPKHLATARELIESSYPHLKLLSYCCSRGVAYHNASLPHEIRRHLEDAANENELKVVAATTTLAEGVDLPFRTTIVVDWLSWQGDKEGPMSPLLFRNIAGRCGRAGRQTEGDTIIFDNPIGDPGFTFDANRGQLIRDQFIEDSSLEISSVLETARSGTEYLHDLESALASQFLAAIPENPEEDDLVQAFATSLYWSTNEKHIGRAQSTVRKIAASILSDSEVALATAASPFKLTEFGKAAVASGFSPESCREIVDVLNNITGWSDKSELVATLLIELGHIREQSSNPWRKEVTKPHRGCRVKKTDTPAVVQGWFSGESLLEIFLGLPGVRKSKSKVSVDEWLSGTEEPVNWDDEFDSFVDWINAVIVSFGSWLMRTCAELSGQANESATEVDWETLSNYCEFGVDTPWAVNAMREGAPAGREVIATLGREFFQVAHGESIELKKETDEKTLRVLTKDQIEKRIFNLFHDQKVQQQSSLQVIDWWQKRLVSDND